MVGTLVTPVGGLSGRRPKEDAGGWPSLYPIHTSLMNPCQRSALVTSFLLGACLLHDRSYLRGETCAPTCGAPDGGNSRLDEAATSDACPRGRGPTMVRVHSAHPFCIDSTEVTRADYIEFTSEVVGVAPNQPPECAWNTSLTPEVAATGGATNLPVRGVDWCDARAYCEWAGKRLCGRIGGGTLRREQGDDPSVSEWYAACSRDGERRFPYGDTFDASACAVEAPAPDPVRTHPKCEGGFAGLFDMSGSVFEWTDMCDSEDAHANCYARGGSYFRNPSANPTADPRAYGCSGVGSYPAARSTLGVDVGFRCCAP